MKIGVIADIHGNEPALKAVLSKLDRRRDIEHIYCLGDMIGIGPNTNEVLDILFTRNDVSMITGNHDEAVLALLKGEEHPQSHSHVKEHHQWIAERMDKQFIRKLEGLPRAINLTVEGNSILFIHYQIEPTKLNDHISQDPFSRIVEPSIKDIRTLFKGREEKLICFGHHHPLHFFRSDRTVFLNPGSLGCNSKPTAPYSIVEIEGDKVVISNEEAAYDNTKYLASYERLQVPDRDFILKIFHGNQLKQ
ncbi:metallophosphoesterase family protein [Bacillus sp. FJAT-27986]|uniref:metallophosphoesterase family protein n=1 Tax=Bacillus sp. FJAT-27986 TaxID=1743146 RepID=UPI00080AE6BC|nr:metallophosphoesterase family protein [Bacillus sp. FJAT-27986]OCA82496.1 YfcE family phosphodiesterase [Bacillus sp. FJAT-27986]